MRKLITTFMIIIFLSSLVFVPKKAEAKTLREAYADLSTLEKEASKKEEEKKLTEKEIENVKSEITRIYDEIKETDIEVRQLEEDIKKLSKSINLKESEIKDLSKYLQVSTGESAYLEYAFGSETITEFIYRMAVVEQLNEYNSNLVIKMENEIERNNANKEELAIKIEDLNVKENSYVQKLDLLGATKSELEEEYSDIESDINEAKILLDYYETLGCKLDEELEECVGELPINVTYKRPVARGYITSNYGVRINPLTGVGKTFHYGIDIGIMSGTPLYPVANGIVTSITGANNSATCGGLIMTIIYNIKGEYYTTAYVHLSSVVAKVGEVVSMNEVVAYSGNSGYCTTGAHLHFTMTEKARYVSAGLYGIPANQTYSSYTSYKANAFNQRYMMGFGGVGSSFYSRDI